VKFSSNLSAIYTKWDAKTFPPIFGLFAIFDRNFAKIVALPSDENQNCVVNHVFFQRIIFLQGARKNSA